MKSIHGGKDRNLLRLHAMAKDVNVKVSMNRKKISARMNRNRSNSLRILKSEILKDTDPFVPMRDGGLKNSAVRSTISSGDRIVYAQPYARFLNEGKVMVGRITRRPFAKKGETKEVINRNLTYSRGGDHWFDKSKKKNIKKWIRVVKKLFG